MEFAKQLKKYRTQKELSQEELAQQLFVSRQAVSKWEMEEGTPDLNNIIKLAEIFNVSLDELVLGIEIDNQPKVDAEEFTYDPNQKKYIRRKHQMNLWEFMAKFWWVIPSFLGGIIVVFRYLW